MPATLLGIYSTAEVLNNWQRKLIEQAFGCRVFNQYGRREIPPVSSTSEINFTGGTKPRSGCSQRINTSAPSRR